MSYTTIFNITEFGAVPDGKTLCTDAFQKAVKKCEEAGGGTVYVPAGRFLTGPIHLVSNTNLHIDAGAVLLFSQDIKDFPTVQSRWEGEEGEVYSPLILWLQGGERFNYRIWLIEWPGSDLVEAPAERSLQYPRPRFICFGRQ